MTKYSLKFFLLIFLFACNQLPEKAPATKDSYLFDGIIHGMNSGWIYIGHPDTTGKSFSYLDSSKITNDSFQFSGKITNPEPCIFVFKNGENSIHLTSTFILDTGHTTGILYVDSMVRSIITGTSSQTQFSNFLSSYLDLRYQQYEIQTSLTKNSNDSSLLKQLKSNETNLTGLIKHSIGTNPNSLVSAFIAEKYMPSETDVETLEGIYNLLENKSNYYSKKLLKVLIAKKRTAIGQIAPPFKIIDNKNIELSNNSFAGKYVLIDFWASWCVPCRAENPYLLKAYRLFSDKGFDIVSISLDDYAIDWQNAVKQDKLPWKQACDLQAVNSPVVKAFGINLIPMNFLLDPEGKIIDKNLRGEQLITVLKTHFQ